MYIVVAYIDFVKMLLLKQKLHVLISMSSIMTVKTDVPKAQEK